MSNEALSLILCARDVRGRRSGNAAVTSGAEAVPGRQDERMALPFFHPAYPVHPCSMSFARSVGNG